MRRALIGIVLALLASSCARHGDAVAVPADEIPFPLSRSFDTLQPGSRIISLAVFLERNGRVLAAGRRVVASETLAESAVRALLEGPLPVETVRGIGTRIPPLTRLLDVSVSSGVARVDFSEEFESPAPQSEIAVRVAQVVFTLSRIPGVRSVRFAIGGAEVRVVTGDGTPVDRPVTTADYQQVAPPR